ncbi:MAG: hypothetical protein GOVbin3250_10 [Prokaryotic dsDNA virus sp.]|nr:MAG: hypothetical protein GOVbin3250_10 [Prokaryotic dsDNA virus sp.]|tara:strand:+ start:27098 stop:27478 length:381 start_codon:yes stop_codon:yes gene_type:complete
MEFDQLSPQMKGAKTRLLNQLEKRLKIAALQMEGRSKQVAFSRFNNQTGRLRQSIAGRFAVVDGKPTAILQAGGQFGGAELEYARFIEFGTRYIKPRLFLARSIEKQQQEIQPKLQDLLRIALIKE